MNSSKEIREILDLLLYKIQTEHPLALSYEEDARYVWPERWKSLIDALPAVSDKISQISALKGEEEIPSEKWFETQAKSATELKLCAECAEPIVKVIREARAMQAMRKKDCDVDPNGDRPYSF